jgi:hypothetical protein
MSLTLIRLRRFQGRVFASDRRFRVLVAGRRFGKTYLAITELCQAAWGKGRVAWYVAPTYRQAKRIVWKPLKEITRPFWAQKPNESELTIQLTIGGTICLRGADNYDSLRGEGLDFVVLDEYASMHKEAWFEVLRPALADRQGKALFIGTPNGLNHFYDLYQEARTHPEWAAFQFTTEQGRNVALAELESAASQMDERVYRQEFQASFENLGAGIVYYAFDRTMNVQSLSYDPKEPIFWAVDFNVNPMCSVIGQRVNGRVHVMEEIVLPKSNTWRLCEEFINRTRVWLYAHGGPIHVQVYGDATGNSRHSSADESDWEIVRRALTGEGGVRAQFCVPRQNPSVKMRVNSMNAMLCNQRQERRLLVHPECKQLIKDFERVTWAMDGNGNIMGDIDKGDPMRTHVSDALGYKLAEESDLVQTGRIIRESPFSEEVVTALSAACFYRLRERSW